MTDVLKIGKKVLTYGVVVTTIFWSIGLAALIAPLAASAQVALNAGDVFKAASTKNVFVYGSDGKRYTFPNDKVFLSWYKDFKTVKTLSDAQVGGIQLAGTVSYRPGTYLVKIQTDPKVYAVEPGGLLRWVETEAIAAALWGPRWNRMVHDVDPAIFPFIYKVGASLSSATYPSGTLVKMGTDLYHIMGMEKHKVTAAGKAANRFDDKFVLTATDLSAYTEGAMIDAYSAKFSDASQLAVMAPAAPGAPLAPPAAAGTGLTVALAQDTPASATVVTDTNSPSNGAQALIPVLKVNFTASADGDVKVTTLKVNRSGISADTDLSNVYLYDGDMKLASNPTIANGVISWSNSSGLFMVAKGTTKSIWVKFDLKNLSSTGKTFTFAINSAASVVTDGAAVNGAFPISSNTYTLAGVTDLGKLTITSVSPSAASTVDPGTLSHEVWRIQVAVLNQDVELRKLKFTVVGSVSVGDLKNFSLWDGGTQIGSTEVDMAADKTVTIMPATPYVFKTGVTRNLSLRADVLAGTNRAFRASIQDGTDISIYDRGYNVYLKHGGSDSFSVLQPNTSGTAVDWSVNTGRLTLSVAADSPVSNVASSTTNATLSKFNFDAVGEDMKVANLTMTCTASLTTLKLANVKMIVNGVQVGTTASTLLCNGTATNAQTFGNTFIVRAGRTAVLSLVADTTDATVGAGVTVHADLSAGSSNASGVVSLSTISTTAQTGRTLTVRGNTVSVAKNASFGDKSSGNPTGTVNASNVKVASVVLTAGTGESVDVTQITLTEAASTCIGTYLQNVKLVNMGGSQLAQTLASPSTSCGSANTYTFNVTPTVTIPAGSDYIVDIYADTKSSTLSAFNLIRVSAVTASGRDTGTSASYSGSAVSLQAVEISSAGTLTAAVDADTPVANLALMGAANQTLAKFKLTAGTAEAVNVTQLVLLNKVSSAATGTLTNIKLVDDLTGVQIGTTLPSFGVSNATTTFTFGTFANLNYQVPKNGIKVIRVVADNVSYEAGGFTTTGQTVALALAPNYSSGSNSFTAQGVQSGTSLTATVSASSESGNLGTALAPTMTLYRAKISVAYATDSPAGAASPTAAQVVMKFVVTNLANAGTYTATVKAVNFDLSTSISNTADRALTVYKDSLSTTALLTTNFKASLNQNFSDTTIYTADFTAVDVSSGSSKTFFVTLDTSNAVNPKTLSLRIGTNDINWSDGVTANITTGNVGNDLPLLYKTFTY